MLWFKKKIKFSIVRNNKTIKHSVTSDLIDRVCYFSSQDYSSKLGRLPCCYGLFNPPNLYSGVGFCSEKFKAIYESQEKYDDKVYSIQPSSCDVKFLHGDVVSGKDWTITINNDGDFLKVISNLQAERDLLCLQ